LFSSCVAHKEMIVMQEHQAIAENLRSHKVLRSEQLVDYEAYRIKVFDQLMIKINAFDGSTEQFLNRESGSDNGGTINHNFDPAALYFNSYSVNEQGAIYLPMLNEVKVVGLTTDELKQKLNKAFTPYLKYPSTSVKLANMRVTILGEVNNPGVHYLYNEKNTLLDAIALAGDFTAFANLKKVKLIRERKRGAETIYLNLSAPDFVNTEYYYARPHDVIYIEPLKAKSLDTSSNSLGIVFSAISIAVLLANIFIGK
ncbi:MAG TPA: hypothetical protein ENK52_03310, partial [Saprospiraceae bacterium]|nr:hypothetical protein [Saprospiraceae bacterium]